jgi:hypothetical protein
VPRKRIIAVHYCGSKCRNLEATKAVADKCTLQQKIFQWSQTWTLPGIKTRICWVCMLEEKGIRMLITCEAVKKIAQALLNHTSHGISSRSAAHAGL